MPSESTSDTIIGKRYRVIRQLGAGAMGSVFEAEHTWTRARVALKVMKEEFANSDVFVSRFMTEAQTAAALQHPNIVRVLDMGQDEDTGELFLVQELLSGRDLGKHLKASGKLSIAHALAIVVPLMEALVAAHAKGVVHRDLKPDNIFLTQTEQRVVPKLIDFGIAKVLGDDANGRHQTRTGAFIGTPYYVSPEQAAGDRGLDGRSDVWSLGVVLYQMLSGERPFTATTASLLIVAIVRDAPRPLIAAAPDLPPAFTEVVMRALVRDRDGRYPSMQAFLDAARPWMGSNPLELAATVQAWPTGMIPAVPTGDTQAWAPTSGVWQGSASAASHPATPGLVVVRDARGGTFAPSQGPLHTTSARPKRNWAMAAMAGVTASALAVTLYATRGGTPGTSRPEGASVAALQVATPPPSAPAARPEASAVVPTAAPPATSPVTISATAPSEDEPPSDLNQATASSRNGRRGTRSAASQRGTPAPPEPAVVSTGNTPAVVPAPTPAQPVLVVATPSAPPAAVAVAAPVAQMASAPSTSELAAVVRTVSGQVTQCFSGMNAHVRVRVSWSPTGEVGEVVVGRPFVGTPVEGCITQAIRHLRVRSFHPGESAAVMTTFDSSPLPSSVQRSDEETPP